MRVVIFIKYSICHFNEKKRNVYRILVGKLEGKRLLRRPRRRWVDNSKMDLREGEDVLVRIGLIWLRIGFHKMLVSS
jgi:hypothetical protein